MITYRSIVDRIRNVSQNSRLVTSRPKIGRMCSFMYNPKTKDKLPFYDIFPLIIPVDFAKDGIFGINFHYLDLNNRKALLKMIAPMNSEKATRKSIEISYVKLRTMGSTIWKPCFKRYLYSHIRTKIVDIPISDWEEVIKLPVAGFVKSTASGVYKASRKLF